MADAGAALAVLQEARDKIALIQNWWTPMRGDIGLCSADAECAMTALPDLSFTPGAHEALEALAAAMGVETFDVPEWNDSHSHAEVVHAFDVAIARLQRVGLTRASEMAVA